MTFPYLTESSYIRLATVTAMYVAQGIQFGLMTVALPAYLAGQGISAAGVGTFIGAVMLPWSLKLVAAPLMDRYTWKAFGRRRPWILLSMLGAVVGYLFMAFLQDPLNQLVWMTVAAAFVSACTAWMDVAIDSQAIEVLPANEQPRANAFMWGGKVIGMSATIAGSAWFLHQYGISATAFLAALSSLIFLFFPLFIREKRGEKLFPWSNFLSTEKESQELSKVTWVGILRKLMNVLLLPVSIYLGIGGFFHGITYGLFDALLPVYTVQTLGWEDQSFSNVASVSGLLSGILALLTGGILISLFGNQRALSIFLGGLVIFSVGGSLIPPAFTLADKLVAILIFSIYLFRTLTLIAFFALAMRICSKEVAATQFSTYMALGNLGISAGASISGVCNNYFSFSQLLLVFAGIALLSMLFFLRVRVE